MRSDILRLYKTLHTWTGIIAGLALFIAFYAGAFTVFKEPIARWLSPPSHIQAVPLSAAPELIHQTLAARPDAARDFMIELSEDQDKIAALRWAASTDEEEEESGIKSQWISTFDAQGRLQVEAMHPSPVADFIDTLHRVIGLPVDNDPARWIMGIIAMLYALALISGVIVLLPTLIKDCFALRMGKNLKRMWLDAHNVVGLFSLPFHLVMAITAAVFAFHDVIYAAQDHLLHNQSIRQHSERGGHKPTPTPALASTLIPLATLLKQAHAVAPSLHVSRLQFQQIGQPRSIVRIWGEDPTAVNPRARGGFIAFDPYTGKERNRDFLPGQQPTANLVISSFFALHMASFGGMAIKWLYFLLALAGAWLFYSGNLLWIESRRKRASKDQSNPAQRRDTLLIASATIGVCLGCICGISFMLLGSKWLPSILGGAVHLHDWLYYGAFCACIGWAFWRGAARAAFELLYLAAWLTAAIPITWLLSTLITYPDALSSSVAIEATALAGALVLHAMARITQKRVIGGSSDSVWFSAR
ncbi:PepSY domain-containing protein [Burkholderiaceae bacterium DAT-1]|nr:PepSY domain-containing protein [Burkholderiaceae bacterium DAT-1]